MFPGVPPSDQRNHQKKEINARSSEENLKRWQASSTRLFGCHPWALWFNPFSWKSTWFGSSKYGLYSTTVFKHSTNFFEANKCPGHDVPMFWPYSSITASLLAASVTNGTWLLLLLDYFQDKKKSKMCRLERIELGSWWQSGKIVFDCQISALKRGHPKRTEFGLRQQNWDR